MSRQDFMDLGVLIVGLSTIALGGCATDSTGEELAQSENEPGFFERILEDESVAVTLPAGTVVNVEFLDSLSSAETPVGQNFETEVTQDVAIDGVVAVPAGSRIVGSVTESRGPKKVGGRSRLSLDFHTLELESGESFAISASFAQAGRSETPKDAAIIGGSTLGGAILGEAVDEGEGTVVGGVVGAIGGVVGAMKTKGKPVTIRVGTRMSLELDSAVVIER